MSFTIRPFRTDEADALRDLRFEALADLPMAFGEHIERARAMGGEDFGAALARSEVWGAFDGDRPMAMAGLARGRGANMEHRAKIVSVYVRPSARGTGAGRAMLRGLVDYGVSLGVEIFELSVGDFNTAARRLYESLGFVECGFLRNAVKIAPEYTHEIQMALHIS